MRRTIQDSHCKHRYYEARGVRIENGEEKGGHIVGQRCRKRPVFQAKTCINPDLTHKKCPLVG